MRLKGEIEGGGSCRPLFYLVIRIVIWLQKHPYTAFPKQEGISTPLYPLQSRIPLLIVRFEGMGEV